MDENYIRRERQRKEETKRVVAQMRASLKVCTMDDVRQHKMRYDQALLIGLQEKGYIMTVDFINQLIAFQNEMREKAGPSSILWAKPQLKDTKSLLKALSDSLTKAEEFRNIDNHWRECETFLKVAVHVAFLHPDWWWLGEQLLILSIKLAEDYKVWDGKYEALSRYAYAKFLVENIKEVKTAHEHLCLVRDLSKDKKWATALIFPDEKDNLYTRCNFLMYICLMREAKSLIKTDIITAIKLATVARKRAGEACYRDGETKALLLRGVCEIGAKFASAAIVSFTKAYYIQQRVGNLEGVCQTQLHLAQAYMMNGDTLLSLKTLLASRDCAAENNLRYYLGEAYRHLGEFYLNNGEPKRATPLLGEALKILHETQNIHECKQVRNLEAISTGLELFPKYLKVLSGVGKPDLSLQSLSRIIDWKDSRKPFWNPEDDSEELSAHTSEEVMNDEESIRALEMDKLAQPDEGVIDLEETEIIELHDNIEGFHEDSNTDIFNNGDQIDEQFVFNEESQNITLSEPLVFIEESQDQD